MNMKVIVGNSTCTLVDCPMDTFRLVRKLLSYKIPEAQHQFAGGFGPRERFLIDKHGVFNTGLLELLQMFFDTGSFKYQIEDTRKRPKMAKKLFSYDACGITPYKQQIEAVEAFISAGRGTVSAVTGSGKSFMMVQLVNALQLKTLIIVPTVYLKQQLRETFLKHFGSLDHVTIENIDSKVLQGPSKYDLLIVDEAHHSASATYQKLNKEYWHGIYHRAFFTATPFRGREEEQLLFESLAGQIIYEITYEDGVENDMICPIQAFVVEAPKVKVAGSKWKEVYGKLVVTNDARNSLLTELLLKFHASKTPTLCLVREIKHGEILSNRGAFAFVSGQDADSKQFIDLFNAGRIKTLIGTVGVVGEGCDTKPCEVVIIAGMGKSRPQFIQMVGRVIRKSPGKTIGTVIIIDDSRSHKWGKTHSRTQIDILNDVYNVIAERIEL